MTYGFRIRFRVGRVRIASHECVIQLTDPAVHAEDIRLGSADADDDKPITETRELQVSGRAYESFADAEEAAQRWRGILEKSLARIKLGADFGRGGPTAFYSATFLAHAEAEAKTRIIPDKLGITVFEAEPQPLFIRVTTEGYPGRYPSHLQTMVAAADARNLAMSVREQLAYDLYSASFSSQDADARFMLLMMALETLIVQEPRSPAVLEHIERLIDATRTAGLASDADSLIAGLEGFRIESVGRAGRRFVRHLGDRRYADRAPRDFFQDCYAFRSLLVHGSDERPMPRQISDYAVALEVMVTDLLSIELLDVRLPGEP